MINLYEWVISQKLPVDDFNWDKNTSQFNKIFTKKCSKDSDEGYFLEVDVQYPEKSHDLQNDLPFWPK